MDPNKNPRSRRGQGTVVWVDGAHSATSTAPIDEAVKTRKRLNAASGEVIDRLKAAHPAFASQRPLAIGIRASLAAAVLRLQRLAEKARPSRPSRPSERFRSALSFIPPDDRETWVRMGMAIKSELGDPGFELWNAWSQQADSYNAKDAQDVWRSLNGSGGVTAGTLFHEAKAQGWRDNGAHQKPTPEELAEWRRVAAERTAKEEAEKARERAQARQNAAWILEVATPAQANHPYLLRKGVTPPSSLLEIGASRAKEVIGYLPKSKGGVLLEGRLLVVPVHVGGELSTVELIDEAGRKSALHGGQKEGGSWSGQDLPDGDGAGLTILIGEGVATVLSAREATGHLVIATLYSSNLKAVAREMRKRFPSADLVILVDLIKDTGLPDDHAIEAARAVGGLQAVPDFGENRPEGATDFNDLHRHRGREVVAECIAAQVAAQAAGSDSQNKDDSESNEKSRLDAVAIHVLSGDPPTQRARSQADILIDIGLKVSTALFCGDDDRPYAVIRDRAEVWPIASKRFREWLRGCYFKRVTKGANANSVRDAIETISAKAQFSGDKRKVFLRTAEADGKLYVDLTDDAWRVVEIDANRWRVLDKSPVMFVRRGSPTPLPEPARGGSLAPLWKLLNVPKGSRPLVAGWLLAALYPSGPYPILVLQGEEGTAKSTAARMLRSLCDPSLVPLRAPTRDEKDFLVGAIGSWCVCLDNLSGMQPWLSDSLCRLSTGGGFAARTLYTDCDETAVAIQRPVILNGIDVGAVRGDLISRTVALTLCPIPDEKRMDPDDLKTAFEKARPRILGALFTGLAQAVRKKPNVTLVQKPRMAGFARLVVAAETALGFKAGEFMAAYAQNLEAGALTSLESSPVAQALIAFMSARKDVTGHSEWVGTATELLDLLAPKTDDHSRSASAWPRSARGMTSALTRLAPALRRIGIHVEHLERTGAKGRRMRLVCKVPSQPSRPTPPSGASCDAGPSGDGSNRGVGSTDTAPCNRHQPTLKNSNEINPSDDGDDGDGCAGPLHTRSPGEVPPAAPDTLIHRVTMHTLDGRTIPEECAEGRTLADWRKHSEIHGVGRPCRVEPA